MEIDAVRQGRGGERDVSGVLAKFPTKIGIPLEEKKPGEVSFLEKLVTPKRLRA